MSAAHDVDARARAIAAAEIAFGSAEDPYIAVALEDSAIVWANASFTRASAKQAPPVRESLRLIVERWERFRRDLVPFDAVYALASDRAPRLLRVLGWPTGEPDARLAILLHRDLQSSAWSGHVADWLDRWPQPALVVTEDEIVFVNEALREALGATGQELHPDALREFTAAVLPVLTAPEPLTLALPRVGGGAVRVMLGRFPTVTPLPPERTVLSGFFLGADPIATRVVEGELTPREAEIAELLLQGHRVRSAATALFLSENTVRNHLRSMFAKLGVRSQAELIERLRSD